MTWLLHPEVLSLSLAVFALVAVIGTAFAFGVRHRLAWAQLPAAARDAELLAALHRREAELLEVERRREALREEVRDLEARLQERDILASEAEYWRSQVEAFKAEYAGLDSLRAEIEQVRESFRQELENLSEAERQAREAQGTVDDARMRVAEAERRLVQVADEDARLREAQASLAEVVIELEARVVAMKEQRAAASDAIEQVRAQAMSLEREAEALKFRREALRADLDHDGEKLQTVRSELEKLGPTLDQLAETRNMLDRVSADLRVKYEALAGLESKERWLNAQIARRSEELSEAGDNAGEPDQALRDLLKPPTCFASEAEDGSLDLVLREPLPLEDEAAALARVQRYLEESGLYFSRRVVRAFHTSLKTAMISPLTVLAGISGTGKSQLPRYYAEAMGIHFLKIPVQPRWDGPQDLFGFYNYIEKRYKATDLARALVHLDPYNWKDQARAFEDRMLLVLLDEMNLARVEYYFSEFLSRLEGRPHDKDAADADTRRPSEIEIDVSREGMTRRVYAGQNVLFVGTMNEDESTLSLSDKVLDRANMLRFPKPDELKSQLPSPSGENRANGYLPKTRWAKSWIRPADERTLPTIQNVKRKINALNETMERLGRPFGHRTGQAMLHYVANYPMRDADGINAALADQIELRILPRLRGVMVEDHGGSLQELAALAEADLHDGELGEAIRTAIKPSQGANGLFVWRGLTRNG